MQAAPMAGSGTVWRLSGFADEISPDLEVQCVALDDLGMRYVEVRSIGYVNVLDLDDGQVAGARRAFDAHQISVSSIGSPIGKTLIEEDFEPQLTRFRRALQVAEALQAPYIRLFSFFMPPDSDPLTHRDEVLRRVAALAGRRG